MFTLLEIHTALRLVSDGAHDIELFRSLAESLSPVADDRLLEIVSDHADPIAASRALTALFYHGGTVGMGDCIRPWLSHATASAMDIYAPAILRDSCILAGEHAAFVALMNANVGEYDTDLESAQAAVHAAFSGSDLQDLLSGRFWNHGFLIRQQLSGKRERRENLGRLLVYLKAFPGDNAAIETLHTHLEGPFRTLALCILVGYNRFVISPEIISQTSAATSEDQVRLANCSGVLFRLTENGKYIDCLRDMVPFDRSGRIDKLVGYLLDGEKKPSSSE